MQKKTSEVFRKAKECIENDDVRFICHAIALQYEWKASQIYENPHSIAEKIVQDRLEGFSTLECWLEGKHGVKDAFNNHDKMKATRLAWLDSLIEEFEAKGD